jgi:hypothetical protein
MPGAELRGLAHRFLRFPRGPSGNPAAHLALDDPEEALTWWHKEILARLEEESRHKYVRAESLAMGYAAIGDADRAFVSLERAVQARSAGLIYLQIEPGYYRCARPRASANWPGGSDRI